MPDGPSDTEPLVLGGRPIADLLTALRSRVVDRVLTEITAEVDVYADLPEDLLQVDVRGIIRENVLAFEAFAGGRPLPPASVEAVAASAYRRAEEGVPLELVQQAYFVGARTTWAAVLEEARPGDLGTVRALGDEMVRFLAGVLPVVTAAYVEELRTREAEDREVRESLTSALLSGRDVLRVAASHGVTLADDYLVLALALDHAPSSGGPTVAGVAARRAVRTVVAEVGRGRMSMPLYELDPLGGLVLLPHHRAGALETGPRDVEEFLGRVRAAGVEARAGYTIAAVEDIPEAAMTSREVLEVATLAGRPPGAYAIEDVLVDFQLSRPGPVADEMGRRVLALADRPDLLDTLRAYLASGQSRARTAEQVRVHPNTVDYRLRRVVELVGHDPATAEGAALLRVGLLEHARAGLPGSRRRRRA